MRPTYESAANLARQEAAKVAIEQATGYELYPLPKFYQFDYCAVVEDAVVRMLEVKVRSCRSSDYPTYMIALSKLLAARQMSEIVPTYLFVQWVDALGYVYLGSPSIRSGVVLGGRKDRGDPDDIEPVALIPISRFTMLRQSHETSGPA